VDDLVAQIRQSRLTDQLAEYALETDFARLPDVVVDAAKRVVLDTLGCIVLGVTTPPGLAADRYVGTIGGVETSSVIGRARAAPPALAALVNGTSAHSNEYDASHVSWGHPAAITVPASLALAEARQLTGRDLINAVVLGHDLGTRLLWMFGGRKTIMAAHRGHSSALFALGVGLASARLLRLDLPHARHALGLSAYCVSSPAAFMNERRHMTKAFCHGQAAFAGITGALLAEAGMEGNDAIIEAPDGVFDLWATPAAEPDRATEELGSYFSVVDTAFKYYPAGYPIQAALWSGLGMMRRGGLTPLDIRTIRVGMSTQAADAVDARPTADISMQDMLSVGLARNGLTFEDAHDEVLLRDPVVRRLRQTVALVRDPAMDQRRDLSRGVWLEIETTGGGTLRDEECVAPGHWEQGGMPWPDVVDKFHLLVSPRLGETSSRAIIELVSGLEELDDLSALSSRLRQQTR
jgi:2-methylcitrate dehydratase PrpD